MAKVSSSQMKILKPYLEGAPNELGEWGMHCPFHDDENRSASLNSERGVWYCMKCNDGGGVANLLRRMELDADSTGGQLGTSSNDESEESGDIGDDEEGEGQPQRRVSEGQIEDWHEQLLSMPRVVQELERSRGLTAETVARFQIGFDQRKKSFTIPVRDSKGDLANVRWYNPNPVGKRRKIWGIPGCNAPRLYPLNQLEGNSEIFITEGEWDALLNIQHGFASITRTAAAGVWRKNWNSLFDDKIVYICQDMDTAGQDGAANIRENLMGHARKIYMLNLPYDVTEKHGKDVTDFYMDGNTADDMEELMEGCEALLRPPSVVEKEYVDTQVIDSFSADKAGERMRMRVTITGKKNPPYLIPEVVEYKCSQDAGAKCNICPMNDLGGSAVRQIEDQDPIILEMMGSTNKQIYGLCRDLIGAQQCNALSIETSEFRAVEELFVRPSVDIHQENASSGDYTSRKIVSVGRHDSLPNSTVEVVGSIYPNPRGQHNEFQAWDVSATETSIDNFELEEVEAKSLEIFQSNRALKKICDISKDMADHVTHIYGRPEMHMLLDLVYHSAMSFKFAGSLQVKGWLEALFIGDTRTGKSEAAQRMIQHYRAGEMVSCESATFAGIVGGLQQMGSGKEWEITWGAIPINDRRLVVLDEVSGLTYEQIAQMSSIRSSGEAQLTKIKSERTWARTRLIWMGNPRNGRMSDYTFGVQAIKPLIGNNEDIARFDLAMSIKQDEVSPEEINRHHEEVGAQKYDSQTSALLLRWVWSRTADQIVIPEATEKLVFEKAIEMGKRYVESPPLVQAANIRIKIARLAVAIAARTFSCTDDHQKVLVLPRHVEDAVRFIDRLYGLPGFGYADISKEAFDDNREAALHSDDAKRYLVNNEGLCKFLRTAHGQFRSQDIQDMLNLSREEANISINTLWKYRLIERQGPNIKIKPILHDILREMRQK